MNKHKIKHMGLDLYNETLPNGLIVNVVVKKNVNNIYATFSSHYGSFHNEFIPINGSDYFEAPLGVAHFLEHKVFEQESGEEPFAVYTKNGADTNASTSYLKTTYLFSGIGCLDENLEYLLDFVQSPYFTDENIEKEKGIIEQEIKMYNDIPYWKLFERVLENAFHDHPLKYPIAGTIKSINKITKEDLYTCYNTFYHPSNMFLTLVGDVDPASVIELVKNNQAKKEYSQATDIVVKEYNERDDVVKEFDEIIFDVEIPKTIIAFKVNNMGMDSNRLKRYLGIYFNLKIGTTSELMERIKADQLIPGEIETEIIIAGNHLLCVLIFESREYKKIIEEIEKEMLDRDILEKDLNRKKKVAKSACVFRSDSIYSIASKINSNIINYKEVILDEHEEIDSYNIDELKDILESVNFDNRTVTVIKNG